MGFSHTVAALILVAGVAFASDVAAQATCKTDGIVLHGLPTDMAVVGPSGSESQPLTQEEFQDAALVVRCRDGYLVHASREGRRLNYSLSGCFHILYGPQVRIVSVDPDCDAFWEDPPHNYTETIRSGMYSIVYQGNLGTRISRRDGLSSARGPVDSYILLRSSPLDTKMRIHIATFDAPDTGEYNARNCALTAKLFVSQPGVTVDYWCELVPLK